MLEKEPQFNQINEQLKSGIAATVLVERTNGDIDTAHVFDRGVEGKVNAFLNPGNEEEVSYKRISEEKISDEYQAELASKLSGVALSGEVVLEVQDNDDERFDAMFGDDVERKPEDAAVRTETDDQRLARERRWADEKDASMKRLDRPEMN